MSKARGLARGSPEAQALAAVIVRLNQQGLVEEEELLRALSIGDRWRH